MAGKNTKKKKKFSLKDEKSKTLLFKLSTKTPDCVIDRLNQIHNKSDYSLIDYITSLIVQDVLNQKQLNIELEDLLKINNLEYLSDFIMSENPEYKNKLREVMLKSNFLSNDKDEISISMQDSKEEEIKRQEEEQKKQEELKKQEEEQKKQEELKKQEEEQKKQEELKRQEEEQKKQEELKKQEEEQKKQEELKKQEEEQKKQEELKRQEEEQKKQEELSDLKIVGAGKTGTETDVKQIKNKPKRGYF